jgi:hypothetical protein
MSDSNKCSQENEIAQVLEAIRANTDAVLKMAQAVCLLADAMVDPEDDREPDPYLDGTPL